MRGDWDAAWCTISPVPRRVFIVEDEADIAELIRFHLQKENYTVSVFARGDEALKAASKGPPDLFLLDIMLPDRSGLDLCRHLRESPALARIPIIFVTARAEEADRVLGLELGADDYIVKPFSPRELVARVRALLRRTESKARGSLLRAGDLEMDTDAKKVTVRKTTVELSPTEYRLLEYLASHAGRVFSRDDLLDAVWQDTRFVTPRSVDVYMRRLREKLEADPERPAYLHTVRGFGYKFEVSETGIQRHSDRVRA